MKITIDYQTRTVDIWSPDNKGYTKDNPYWISFDRFRTHDNLISWVRHLCEKNWWNSFLTRELISIWEEINNTKIGDA